MFETEHRFIRNKEKTNEVIKEFIQLFGEDYLNRDDNEYLRKVVYSHFILDDQKTGTSYHCMMNINGPLDGMCLCEEPDVFNFTKNFFHQLAIDRNSPIIFYFKASTFQVNPNGSVNSVY